MNRKRILLCEDNQNFRKTLVAVLKNDGHHVLDFNTADEALLLGRDEFDSVEVLLTDVDMPGTDGVELARIVSVLYPAISIFLMSGKFVAPKVIKQIPAKFFQKPFSVAYLKTSIQTAVQKKKPVVRQETLCCCPKFKLIPEFELAVEI